MKKGPPILRTAAVALVAGLVLAPPAALADRSQGGPAPGGRPVGGGHVGGHPFGLHRFEPHRFSGHRFFHRHGGHFGGIAPVIVYASPPVYYAPSALYAPPVGYDPPVGYAPPPVYGPPSVYMPPMSGTVSVAPAPPPTPRVIEYPTGRYELRGDGVTTPYTWVWIPNPPPPPPPGPPSEAPAPSGPAASGDRSPAHRSELYRWTDEQGVVHWTDRWDVVPEQYRSQATRLRPS